MDPNSLKALKIASIAAATAATIKGWQEGAEIFSGVSNGAVAVAEIAAIDGAAGIMAVAGSVAALTRICAVGCRVASAITFASAMVKMFIIMVEYD